MLTPSQILLLNEFFTQNSEIYFLCEKYDCDVDQMNEIIAAILPLLPGKGIDFEAILSKDPIASDPLVIQCNRAIGQLDQLYDRLLGLYDNGFNGYSTNKRTTFNPAADGVDPRFHNSPFNSANKHNGAEKVETTNEPNKHRFRILEAAAKCLDRSLKTQITLTQRREKLARMESPRSPSAKRYEEKPYTPLNGHSALSGIPPYRGAVAPPTAGIQKTLPETTQLATPSAIPSSRRCSAKNPDDKVILDPSLSQPEVEASEIASATTMSLTASDGAIGSREEEPVTLLTELASQKNFGPPKSFTPNANIAEFHETPYAYRDALKAKKQAAVSHLPGGLPSAGKVQCVTPQNENHTANNMAQSAFPACTPDKPPHHKRE